MRIMSTGKAIARKLKKELNWLKGWKKANWGRPSVDNRAANLIIGCFYVLKQSTTDLRAWIDRKPHRQHLKNCRRAIRLEDGRRAIEELVELTISGVDARTPSHKWHTGPLDCSCPPRSQAQLETARRGLEAARRHVA